MAASSEKTDGAGSRAVRSFGSDRKRSNREPVRVPGDRDYPGGTAS